ncbi:hypothetical protein BGLT_03839 [Caballeronia glathei]|uniref:DUF1453 domain-containing protein n=1 Tax=Caballeronia glathei TaxID=60547 RepID=A0A069PJD0_9BURK|nr:DUF6622 family protein [Caballeronia glathei]KDR40665.1 hypothetical protein BG61_23520 [Caballeronia glathei]CDY74898.1 hypothetical protein BGLT_03839 [Caballeronia glathei]
MSVNEIVSGTPVWVWALLAFLVSRGLKALNGGTAPLAKLAIVPAVFAAWGIVHLSHEPAAGWGAACAWIAGAAGGLAIGVALARSSAMTIDREQRTVTLPGSAAPLILILLTFASKFWLGVELATATATATSADAVSTYVLLDGLVSGIVAGIFAGRFLTYWLAFRPVPAAAIGQQ